MDSCFRENNDLAVRQKIVKRTLCPAPWGLANSVFVGYCREAPGPASTKSRACTHKNDCHDALKFLHIQLLDRAEGNNVERIVAEEFTGEFPDFSRSDTINPAHDAPQGFYVSE